MLTQLKINNKNIAIWREVKFQTYEGSRLYFRNFNGYISRIIDDQIWQLVWRLIWHHAWSREGIGCLQD